MKKLSGFTVLLCALSNLAFSQVDTTFVYKTGLPYGTLDIRIAKSATRYYYLQENKTVSFRESAPGVKTNTFRDMTSWDSSPYTQGNLREKNGAADYFIMNYRLLHPLSYKPSYAEGYPIIIMMHGAGERGNCWENRCYHDTRSYNVSNNNPPAPTEPDHRLLNNDHNLLHGGSQHLSARNAAGSRLPNDPGLPMKAFPGFVLFPQNLNGWTAATVQDAIKLARLVIKKYNIDENRVYIHGLSNGGSAVYEAIKRAPWLFTAALPMSSVTDSNVIGHNLTSKIAHIPLWIFQGGEDTAPSPARTEGYIKEFREAGAVVRYSKYEALGHGVWNTAYKEPDFFRWMLLQTKSDIHTFANNSAICLTNGQGVRMELAEGFRKYQWEKNGVIISGATGAKYTATTPGTYRARFSRVSNPTASQWNNWSSPVTVTQQNPAQPVVEQIGTVILKDLNNFADAKLKAVGDFAHYYWYKNGALIDLPGTQDDTIQHPVIKAAMGNGAYTLVTAGFDNCPSPPSKAKHIFFNNLAPVNVAAPTNFKGQVLSATSAKLTWTDAANNEGGYEIWRRKVTGASTFSKWEMPVLTSANVATFTDNKLEPSATYQFKIRGVSNTGRSNYTPAASNQFLTITTSGDNTLPTAPSNLTAKASGINTITLNWKAGTDNIGIRQYRIYYGSKSVATGSPENSFVLKNLTLNTNYTFTVKTEDLDGNLSPASNAATASTFVNGLYYEHTTGSWSDLDAINWNMVEFSGAVPNFTLGPRTQEDYFNFKFDGYLYITTGGAYQFRTVSSDGSRIELDGVIVVDNDGVHGTATATGPVQTLTSGAKRITVRFFETTDNQFLSVRYKGPDTGGAWWNIPAEALRSGGTGTARIASQNEAAPSSEESISVYPNPTAQNEVNVQMIPEEDAPSRVRLLDLTGRSYFESTVGFTELQEGIKIQPGQSLPEGMYVLIIQQNKKVFRKTIAVRN